jgi:GntR family transcriptional regulator, histidine utilization repressor
MDETTPVAADRDVSLHRRILADIEGKIVSGEWAPGARIPFEVELARAYGCSRMTVNKVMGQLVQNGLIERRRRSGSTVRRPTSHSAVLEIRDIAGEVASLGEPYGYRLLAREPGRADAVECAALGLARSAPVLRLSCLHLAGAEPFCAEERLINLAAVVEAADESFQAIAPGVWLMRKVPWSLAEHTIRAVGAHGEISQILGVEEGFPCLTMERRTNAGGPYLTWVRLTYRGDRHALTASFTPS